jgi:hypothetical protein
MKAVCFVQVIPTAALAFVAMTAGVLPVSAANTPSVNDRLKSDRGIAAMLPAPGTLFAIGAILVAVGLLRRKRLLPLQAPRFRATISEECERALSTKRASLTGKVRAFRRPAVILPPGMTKSVPRAPAGEVHAQRQRAPRSQPHIFRYRESVWRLPEHLAEDIHRVHRTRGVGPKRAPATL